MLRKNIRSVQTMSFQHLPLIPVVVMIATESLASICILFQGLTVRWRPATAVIRLSLM